MTTADRRLIEGYLPLDELNATTSREKLHPRRYVERVRYWPTRRPITATPSTSRLRLTGTLCTPPGVPSPISRTWLQSFP